MISVTNHGLNRPLEAAVSWQRIRVAPRITLVPYYGGSMRIGSFFMFLSLCHDTASNLYRPLAA